MLLHGFAAAIRLELLAELADGEVCVGELARRLEREMSQVSSTLGDMKKLGLLRERKAGKQHFYRLSPHVRVERLPGSEESGDDELRIIATQGQYRTTLCVGWTGRTQKQADRGTAHASRRSTQRIVDASGDGATIVAEATELASASVVASALRPEPAVVAGGAGGVVAGFVEGGLVEGKPVLRPRGGVRT